MALQFRQPETISFNEQLLISNMPKTRLKTCTECGCKALQLYAGLCESCENEVFDNHDTFQSMACIEDD